MLITRLAYAHKHVTQQLSFIKTHQLENASLTVLQNQTYTMTQQTNNAFLTVHQAHIHTSIITKRLENVCQCVQVLLHTLPMNKPKLVY